jgi:hypothetical protein
MKNCGTPAIEENSESGSGGVSADGEGARRLLRTFVAEDPPVDPRCAPLPARPGDFDDGEPDPTGAPGVLPCGRWAFTCGVGMTGGAPVAVGEGVGACAGTVAGGGAGTDWTVEVGVVWTGASEALEEVLVSVAELVGCVATGPSATLAAGASRASAPRMQRSGHRVSSRTVIVLNCRGGS